MSQINDALKRVRQTQEPTTMHTNENGLEHVEEQPAKQSSIPIIIFPILLFLILATAAFFLVRGMDRKKAEAAKARETQSGAAQAEPASEQPASAPKESIVVAKTASAPTPVAVAVPPTATTNVAPAVAAGPASTATTPGAYKVNSIFYKPKNPAAVVNGKMVLVGDRLGDAKVVAIEKDAVIIEVDGAKKTLTLF
jgi:hypothetical protein